MFDKFSRDLAHVWWFEKHQHKWPLPIKTETNIATKLKLTKPEFLSAQNTT